jgi:hypothetical protein
MPRILRLTRRAQAPLVDNRGLDRRVFGQRQALAYQEELIARCRAITDGT